MSVQVVNTQDNPVPVQLPIGQLIATQTTIIGPWPLPVEIGETLGVLVQNTTTHPANTIIVNDSTTPVIVSTIPYAPTLAMERGYFAYQTAFTTVSTPAMSLVKSAAITVPITGTTMVVRIAVTLTQNGNNNTTMSGFVFASNADPTSWGITSQAAASTEALYFSSASTSAYTKLIPFSLLFETASGQNFVTLQDLEGSLIGQTGTLYFCLYYYASPSVIFTVSMAGTYETMLF